MSFQQKIDFSPLWVQFFAKNNVRFGFLVKKYVGLGQPEFKKGRFSSDLFWFSWKTKKSIFYIFWFYHKIQNKSLQKPLFSNLGLTHTEVFFDVEFESDVIFLKNVAPKGSKSCFFIGSKFLKIEFQTKNRFFTSLGSIFRKK